MHARERERERERGKFQTDFFLNHNRSTERKGEITCRYMEEQCFPIHNHGLKINTSHKLNAMPCVKLFKQGLVKSSVSISVW